MPKFKLAYTTRELADLYQASPDTIRKLIDRLSLGNRVGNWRIVQHSELGRLEDGLRAIGYTLAAEVTS